MLSYLADDFVLGAVVGIVAGLVVPAIIRRIKWSEIRRTGLRYKVSHLARSLSGKDPHRWSRQDTLHGLRGASDQAKLSPNRRFYGSGRITSTWVCRCGETRDTEPEGAST